MTLPRYIVCFLLFAAINAAFADGETGKKNKKAKFLKDPADKSLFEKAELLYEEGNYLLALPHYRKLEEKFPAEEVLRLRLGSCLTYKSDETKEALEYLSGLDPKKMRKTEYGFFLARAYHLNYKFDESLLELDNYLKQNPSTKRKDDINRLMENCRNAKIFIASPTEATIENLSEPVNTTNSEYVPVISSDESVLIFTYRGEKSTGGLMNANYEPDPDGEYSEDVFISYKTNDAWSEPVPITTINTNEHDAAIALSNDGQKLFIYKDSEGGGDIYISQLKGMEWSVPEKLLGDVNTDSWEGSASLSADERTLYFSSERPGGFGGRDIYRASLLPDGTWGNVINMGPDINTSYNDDAPFIHPDGRLLHYSSEGRNSMGGYDIFRTVMSMLDSSWSEPVNLASPVNTTGDDIYYVVSADGKRGYYSSGKTGGYGQHDIYIVEPAVMGEATLLVALKGTVTVDDQPVEAIISVKYNGKDKELARFNSNSATGKYLVNLPVGHKYVITYKVNEFLEVKEIDATTLKTFTETIEDKKFYTNAFRRLKAIKDSLAGITTVDSSAIKMKLPEVLPKGNQQLSNEDVIKAIGDLTVQGLSYSVQIGAYNKPQNFKYSQVLSLGQVDKKQLEDGITRFTIGSYNKLKEADQLKGKVVAKGITDAFVIAIYNGKRMMLEELVKQGIVKLE
jgi:tetratricopeptide (TPR) repeat protein